LGSTFEDSSRRDVDNFSLVAWLCKEKLAAVLAMESPLMDEQLPEEDYAAVGNEATQTVSCYAAESQPKEATFLTTRSTRTSAMERPIRHRLKN